MIVFYTLHFICVPFAEWDLIFHMLEVIHLCCLERYLSTGRQKLHWSFCRSVCFAGNSHLFSILTLACIQLLLLAGLFRSFISVFFIVYSVCLHYYLRIVLFVPLASLVCFWAIWIPLSCFYSLVFVNFILYHMQVSLTFPLFSLRFLRCQRKLDW